MMWGIPLVLGFSLILMFGVFVYHWILNHLDFQTLTPNDEEELSEGELL